MEARKLLKNEVTPGVSNQLVEGLVRKWGADGLLNNIKNPYRKAITAILLENTSRGMKELLETGSVSSADIKAASRFVFPLVRRVWPGLIANDIVSVQPMTMPVGAIAYLQVIYGTTKGSVAEGDEIPIEHNRFYSTDYIDREVLAVGDGEKLDFGVVFDYLPIVPGTVSVSYTQTTAKIATDVNKDGKLYVNNTWVATIDYRLGTLEFQPDNVPDADTEITSAYRYNMELNTRIPEISVSITFEEIQARTRKLKASWSPEAMEDMRALYAIDAEAELVQAISNEIALELDREIIMDLFEAVVEDPSGNYREWDRRTPAGVADIWHIQSLVHTISTVSNLIHKRTFRAPANWIIVSPDVAALLECIPQFNKEGVTPGDITVSAGIQRIGVLAGQWITYRDPYLRPEYVLVGYKGSVFYDTGYVYAPYIPLQATPTFYDPDSFTMKKGLRTRYNKKLVRSEYYGKVKVLNLGG